MDVKMQESEFYSRQTVLNEIGTDGQEKLKDAVSSFSEIEKKNFYSIIEFLIDNYFLDYSFNKVEDYKKYYNI